MTTIQGRKRVYTAAIAAILIAIGWGVVRLRSDTATSSAPNVAHAELSLEGDSQVAAQKGKDYPRRDVVTTKIDLESTSKRDKLLMSQVVARAERGDAAAQRELSDQYAECSIFINAGESAYRQMLVGVWDVAQLDPANRRRAEGILEEQVSICSQLMPYVTDVRRDAVDWRKLAVLSGDNSAIASELVLNFDSIKRDQRLQLADTVIRSGDANAILRFSELMYRQIETGNEYLDSISGSPFGYASLAIYACRHGAECGRDSAVMRGFCLHMGLCGYASLEDALFVESLPPSSRQNVNIAVDNIAAILGRR